MLTVKTHFCNILFIFMEQRQLEYQMLFYSDLGLKSDVDNLLGYF